MGHPFVRPGITVGQRVTTPSITTCHPKMLDGKEHYQMVRNTLARFMNGISDYTPDELSNIKSVNFHLSELKDSGFPDVTEHTHERVMGYLEPPKPPRERPPNYKGYGYEPRTTSGIPNVLQGHLEENKNPAPQTYPRGYKQPEIEYPRAIKRPDDWPAPPTFEVTKSKSWWPFRRSQKKKTITDRKEV